MDSFPPNLYQQFLLNQPSQTHQSKTIRDLYDNNMECQNSHQVAYFNNPNLLDHHPNLLDRHPPYPPAFQVAGLVQEENRPGLQLNLELESKKKRPIEQAFMENNNNNNSCNNNSQISSFDLFRARSMSTGLGLSLENPRVASPGDPPLLELAGDALERELQRQNAEIDRYIKHQGDRLRNAILEKFQASQVQLMADAEERIMQKLWEKETQAADIKKKNMELESQVEQLVLEANAWQQRAKCSENMINSLKLNLQQVYAQSRDSKEGCGDSEVDDTAGSNSQGNDRCESMRCKVCGVNEVCMVLLPCEHLCLCKECESKLSVCPLCHSSKYIGMEVYI